MKKSILALAAFATLASVPMVHAKEGLSFNISTVSLYKYRGVDLDSRQSIDLKSIRPAIQGGVDYSFGNGFYVGNWNSTGTFGNANLKANLYGGFRNMITSDIELDVGLLRYYFPNDKVFGNSGEVYVGLTMNEYSVKYFRGITSNVNKGNNYLVFGYSRDLNNKFNVGATLGFNDYKGSQNYQDYSLSVNYNIDSTTTFGATIAGTNKRAFVGNEGKPRLILSLGKSF